MTHLASADTADPHRISDYFCGAVWIINGELETHTCSLNEDHAGECVCHCGVEAQTLFEWSDVDVRRGFERGRGT